MVLKLGLFLTFYVAQAEVSSCVSQSTGGECSGDELSLLQTVSRTAKRSGDPIGQEAPWKRPLEAEAWAAVNADRRTISPWEADSLVDVDDGLQGIGAQSFNEGMGESAAMEGSQRASDSYDSFLAELKAESQKLSEGEPGRDPASGSGLSFLQFAASPTHNGASSTNTSIYIQTLDECTPKCTWKCSSPKCDEVCSPKCGEADCSTRCDGLDIDKCKMMCAEPVCKSDCPKDGPCTNKCTKPMCKMECSNMDQICHNICKPPSCKMNCKAPTDCPQPDCVMQCDTPPSACKGKTYAQAPSLLQGFTEVTQPTLQLVANLDKPTWTAHLQVTTAEGALGRRTTRFAELPVQRV